MRVMKFKVGDWVVHKPTVLLPNPRLPKKIIQMYKKSADYQYKDGHMGNWDLKDLELAEEYYNQQTLKEALGIKDEV